MSRSVLLYSEMISTGAILFGDRERYLAFDPAEHPVALQLGGGDPAALAECARIGAEYGYDEINLNVGCPSDRVAHARFGASLMAEPELVADCVAAMRAACHLPVTVKTRIGIDDSEEYEFLDRFVATVAEAGCGTFIIHARKAWLQGLSPKQNREVPPLRYDVVHRLKRENPGLEVVINGGIRTLDAIDDQLALVDGVMIGREAYENPFLLTEIERHVFAGASLPTRHQVVEQMLPYIDRQRSDGVPLNRITRHMLGLFQGVRGARYWRRHLSQNAHLPGAGVETVRESAELPVKVA
jgi:tRNA-dihydrouridine synthase A